MFRDKPGAFDRLTDAISSIGDRIADLEEQVVERFNPTPSAPERVRRAIARTIPGYSPPSVASRYLPDFISNWSVPTLEDARSSYRSVRDALPDVRAQLADLGSHLPDWRWTASRVQKQLPDPRLPRFGSFRRGMEAQKGVDFFRGRPALGALVIVGGVAVVAGTAFFVTKTIADHTEEPDYDAVRKDGEVEIRDYDALVVAETIKSGYHEKARSAGFETLADYISASNRSGKKIAMTAPVLQQLSESDGQTKGWAIRFVMPKKYAKSALPVPSSTDVALKDVPARRVVAIRFSGNFSASLASKKLMALYNYIADENLKQKGDPEYAFYNPPWVPGFMKRNEIFIEIER